MLQVPPYLIEDKAMKKKIIIFNHLKVKKKKEKKKNQKENKKKEIYIIIYSIYSVNSNIMLNRITGIEKIKREYGEISHKTTRNIL